MLPLYPSSYNDWVYFEIQLRKNQSRNYYFVNVNESLGPHCKRIWDKDISKM